MKTTVSDIRGRAGQGGAISLGVKTFDSVVSGKLDGFFSGPNSFFSAEKNQAGCCENMVVIHKKSSIPLGQEAISKIRSCFYCFYIEEEQNKYNSTKVQLESLRSGNLLVGLPPIGGFCKKAWNWKASHPFAR